MKSGAEDDPFEQDEGPDAADRDFDESSVDEYGADVDALEVSKTGREQGTPVDVSGLTTVNTATPEPPYVLRRKTAKEDRKMIQFFLRDEYGDTGERQFKSRVEEILDTEVSKFDLREAAYAFAQENPEEVAALLSAWGYEYR